MTLKRIILKNYNNLVGIIVPYGVIWSLNYEFGVSPHKDPYKRISILEIY
jgi:hypothetical protein